MLEEFMVEFTLNYPHKDETKELKIKQGEILFLVGANGTGKSTLMHHFAAQNFRKVLRVTAHRQVWFQSNSIDLTPASRVQLENNITQNDQNEQSRWKDDYAAQRSQVIIFDLLNSENVEARKIADAAKAGNMKEVEMLAKNQSPVQKMNDILRISNLHFQVQVDKESNLVATRDRIQQYSIAQLSDGERNSLLIIANVLTAPKNTLILLDEPERHLHRSIVSPLINTLLGYREDCAFVVSTHDVTLPHDQKNSSALLLREYFYTPKSWVTDHIDNIDEMDEEVSLAVLGSRRILLFVEGSNSSLDIQLYQILYPNVSIKALGSCMDVERAVKGIRATKENHWILAYGIIDRDNKQDDECKKLHEKGIIPLEQYSVESLYYHPVVVRAILNRVASLSNHIDVDSTMKEIQDAVIEEVQKQQDTLAAKLVERKVRDLAARKSPNWKEILKENVDVSFSTVDILKEEKKYISSLFKDKDIEKLICRYPVRETQVLTIIVNKCQFLDKKKYEAAVRKMLIDSEESLNIVRNLIAPATKYLN